MLYDGTILSENRKYYYYNPSIFRNSEGKIILLSRIGESWCSEDYPDDKSIPKTFFTSGGSENFVNMDLLELPSYRKTHVKTIKPVSKICGSIHGGEDPRGFSYKGKNYALCMEYRKIQGCVPGIVLLDLDTEEITDLIHPVKPNSPQKNWLPLIIDDKFYIVTDTNPHRIVEPDLKTGECEIVAETPNPFINDDLRGSAGYIHVDDCYIGIVHHKYGVHSYSHLFYAFQDTFPFNIVAMSDKFCIKVSDKSCKDRTQMLTGIILVDNIVYITGGHHDRNCFITSLPLRELLKTLDFENRRKNIIKYIPRIVTQDLPKQKIPRKIISILILDDEYLPSVPKYMQDCLESWHKLSPEYDIQILDKKDCVQFLRNNFGPEVLDVYNSFKPYAYKCDLMRICWLYIYGGIYKDIRQTLLVPLEQIIEPDNEIVFPKDLVLDRRMDYPILNSFIGCVPKHPIMKKYIDMIVKNVQNKYYGVSSLDITGPNVFGHAGREILGGKGQWIPGNYGSYQILNHEGKYIYKNGSEIIQTKPAKAEFTADFVSGNIYGQMWKERNVYVKP
jgi:hypothetical protein